MAANFYLRGHKTQFIENRWIYADTREPTAGNPRQCGHCSNPNREDGHDGCLGELPGIMNACCGHGIESGAYVQFLDGFTVRDEDARIVLGVLKTAAGTES